MQIDAKHDKKSVRTKNPCISCCFYNKEFIKRRNLSRLADEVLDVMNRSFVYEKKFLLFCEDNGKNHKSPE